MSDLSENYKEKYKIIWLDDFGFSQKFTPQIKEIISKLPLPKNIQDNLGTQKDRDGSDLTVRPLEIGVRVRRASYTHFDEYTEDDKERDTMKPDIGIYGYATPDESKLQSLIVFDHHDFRKARKRGLLKSTRNRNTKHSLVWFTCYPISDIIEHCKIYGIGGSIGGEEVGNSVKL